MPSNRIQPRTWFVEFRLTFSAPPSDADIRVCIIDIMDRSNEGCRRIRGLEQVSFAYTSRETAMPLDNMRPDPAGSPAYIVDVVGFAHSNESILDTTMRLWIQDSRVIEQRWTPVSIKQGGNWMQQEIIKKFFDDCKCGRRVRVDWLWTGDVFGSIKKGGRPKRLHPGADTSEPPPPFADLTVVRSPPEQS